MNPETEKLSKSIYKTILTPLAKKLKVHPTVLIEHLYEQQQYGKVRATPKVVSDS